MTPQPNPVRFDPAPPRVLVCAAPMIDLARFKAQMALEGEAVDLGRMCLDRRYARERLAAAHGSARDELRALAVALFAGYERGPSLRMLVT